MLYAVWPDVAKNCTLEISYKSLAIIWRLILNTFECPSKWSKHNIVRQKLEFSLQNFFKFYPYMYKGNLFLRHSHLWLCFGKWWISFELIDQFLGVDWLILGYYWVGNTLAQSIIKTTCMISRLFPSTLSPLWSLVLLVHDIQFWKAFDGPNKYMKVELVLILGSIHYLQEAIWGLKYWNSVILFKNKTNTSYWVCNDHILIFWDW